MAKALSLEPTVYVLEFERTVPSEDQTKWHIRPLKWKERAEIQDGMIVTEINMRGPKDGSQHGTMRHLSGTQAKLALEKGLLKIDNLIDDKGDVIKYVKSMPYTQREGILDRIPPEWVKEITDEILKMSGLQKDEEKN